MHIDPLIGNPKATARGSSWRRVLAMMLFAVAVFCSSLCRTAAGSMCGSGFVVQQDGYILTNYHVIKNATKITVTVPGHQAATARVITVDQQKDLAILQISLSNLTPLPIASSETVQVLDSITVLGYPLPTELGTALSASDGKVNAVREAHDGGTRLFQIDANVNPGTMHLRATFSRMDSARTSPFPESFKTTTTSGPGATINC